jgi:hypothetical protein
MYDRMSKRKANLLFRVIALLFSAVFALMTLLGGVELTQTGDRIAAREAELRELEDEGASLRVQAACALSLEELEEIALRELGMQRAGPGQILIIHEK